MWKFMRIIDTRPFLKQVNAINTQYTNFSHGALVDVMSQKGLDTQQTFSDLGLLTNLDWMCEGDSCNTCARTTVAKRFANLSVGSMLDEYNFMGDDFGRALPDRSQVRLSCFPMEQMWFEVMASFPGT